MIKEIINSSISLTYFQFYLWTLVIYLLGQLINELAHYIYNRGKK